MIASKLIVGGSLEKRRQYALNIAQKKLKELPLFSHPDFFLLEGEQSIGIDKIRELEKKLTLKPYLGTVKIALVLEAEKLTLPAQNAFLKTLEETPPSSLIILTVPEINSLLPTVVSRCQIIKIKPEKEPKIKEEIFPILPKRVGEALKTAALYGENKNQAQEFCQQLLLLWRGKMLKTPSSKIAQKIHFILTTLFLLKKNVNPSLATGNLLLKLIE